MDIIEHNTRLNSDAEWWYNRYPTEFNSIIQYQKDFWGNRFSTTANPDDFITYYLNTSIEEHQSFIDTLVNDTNMYPIYQSIQEWHQLHGFIVEVETR